MSHSSAGSSTLSRRRRGGPLTAAAAMAAASKQFIGLSLERDVPLFPLLATLEVRYTRYVVAAGLMLDAVQVAALAVSPHQDLSVAAAGMLKAAAFWHLPLYDPLILGAPWAVAVGGVAVLLVMCIFVAVASIVFVAGSDEDDPVTLPKPVALATRWTVHSVATWAYVPAMTAAASLLFCTDDGAGLHWFPERACGDATSVAMRTLAVVAMVVITLLALFVQTVFHDLTPGSRHYWARAHTILDWMHVLFRGLCVVTLHAATARGHLLWYNVFVAVAAFVAAAATAVVMPYQRLLTQRVRVGSLLLASAWAAIAAGSHAGVTDQVLGATAARDGWNWVREHYIDAALVAIAVPAAAALGAWLATLRVSRSFRDDMAQLREGRVRSTVSLFPRNLPAYDERTADGVELERHFPFVDDEEHDLEIESVGPSDAVHFTTPMLDGVYVSTDVEVAARFIAAVEQETDLDASEPMLAFAARLFCRGRRRFANCRRVWLAYIAFLYHDAKSMQLALLELNGLRAVDTPLGIRYQAWRMQTRTEQLLHMNKSSRGQSAAALKRRHREVLQSISDFWFLLTSEEFDGHALAVTTASVIGFKEECSAFYRRVLTKHTSNVDFVAMYSKYCEDVLQDGDAAAQTRQCLSEIVEMKNARATRGAKKQRGGKELLTPLPLDADTTQTESLDFSAELWRIRIGSLLCAATLLLLTCGFVSVTVIWLDFRVQRLQAVFYSGRLRSVAAEAGVTVVNYVAAATATVAPATLPALRRGVLAARADFLALTNALTFGDLGPATPEHRDFVRAPQLSVTPLGPRPVSFWAFGRTMPELLGKIADDPAATAGTQRYFLETLAGGGGAALNHSTGLFVRDSSSVSVRYSEISLGLLVGAVIVTLAAVAQLLTSLNKVTQTKAEILRLFTFIRRDRLRSLYAKSRRCNAAFEAFLAKKPRDKIRVLLEREDIGIDVLNQQQDSDAKARQLAGGNSGVAESAGSEGQTSRTNSIAQLSSVGKRMSLPPTPPQKPEVSAQMASPSGLATTSLADVPVAPPGALAALMMELPDPEPTGWRWACTLMLLVVAFVAAVSLTLMGMSYWRMSLMHRDEATGVLQAAHQARVDIERALIKTEDFVITADTVRFASVLGGEHSPQVALPAAAERLAMALMSTDADAAHIRRAWRAAEQLKAVGTAAGVAVALVASAADPAFATSFPLTATDPWGTRLDLGIMADDIAYNVQGGGIAMPPRPLPALLGFTDDTATGVSSAVKTKKARNIIFSDAVFLVRKHAEAELGHLVESAADSLEHAEDRLRRFLAGGVICAGGLAFLLASFAARRAFLRRKTPIAAACGLVTVVALLTVASGAWQLVSVTVPAPWGHKHLHVEHQLLLHTSEILGPIRRFVAKGGDQRWLIDLDDAVRRFSVETAAVRERAFETGTGLLSAAAGPLGLVELLDPTPIMEREGLLLATVDPAVVVESLREPLATLATLASVAFRLQFAVTASTLLPGIDARAAVSAAGNWDFASEPGHAASWATFRAQAGAARIDGAGNVVAGTCSGPAPDSEAAATGAPPTTALQGKGHYSTTPADMTLPDGEKRRLAIEALVSVRWETAQAALLSKSWGAGAEAGFKFEADQKETRSVLLAVFVATVAVGAIALAAVGAVAAFNLYTWARGTNAGQDTRDRLNASIGAIQSASGGKGGQKLGAVEESSASSQDSGMTKMMEPALLGSLLIAVLCATGGLVAWDVTRTAVSPRVVEVATYREFLVALPLLEATRVQQQPTHAPLARLRVALLLSETERLPQQLYFDGGNSFVGLGTSASQDDLLFAKRVTAEQAEAQYGGPTASSCPAGGETESYYLGLPPSASSAGAAGLSSGLAAAFDTLWTAKLRRFVHASTDQETVDAAKSLAAAGPPLLRALQRSAQVYYDREVLRLRQGRDVLVAAGSIGVVLVIVYLLLSSVRFAAAVHRDEASARTMLQLIPLDVVDETPKIQEFLEQGGSDRPPADSEVQVSDAISHMSTLPVIVIDRRGKILKFSAAAERAFGYGASEVTGINVKMLMPQDLAEQHDGFLSRYERTRVKHVIDASRRLRARRKDGSLFPLELCVRELGLGSADHVFVGFARDMSEQQQLGVQDSLNRYVLEMSEAPIIAIDAEGTILMVNQRATHVFGYAKHEMVGENVKILMPADIAQRHDFYLQRYLETGVKKIIDSTRVLTGQRKSGETFQIQLTVREIKSTQMGASSTYVAYAVDVTRETEAQVQNEINDLISDLSPIPIVAINDEGTILKFSRAASRLFGYTSDELVRGGENIQLLVPPRYGDHSQYMRRYRVGKGIGAVGRFRKVLCMKRNKSMFVAELVLKEIVKEGAPPVFLAYIEDVSTHVESEANSAITSAAVEFSMVPVITIRVDGTIVQFNEAAVMTFGYTTDDALGGNVKMLMPDQVAERHDGYLSRYLETRVKTVVDRTRYVIGKRKDGQLFSVELNIREVISSETQDDTIYIGYARDVTSRRNMMRQHMINELVADLSIVPIIAIDADARIQSFSRAAEEVFGYHALEVAGQNISMLMENSVAEKHDGYLTGFHKRNVDGDAAKDSVIIDRSVTQRARRKDGLSFNVELSVREIKRDKERSSFVGFVRDTTNDGQLEEETALGTTVRNLASVPIVQIGTDGLITFFSHAASAMFGYTSEEALGKNVALLMTEEQGAVHDERIIRYLKGRGVGAVGSTRRVQGVKKDGTIIELELTLGEVRSEQSSMHFFVAYLRDVSEQIALERANQTINVITDLSTVPIIAIDASGFLIKFSRAAETAFQHKAADVLGKNVKLLMPQHIAEKHDGYLRTYQRTGIKCVIDNVVRQTGLTRNGTLFPLDLHVKEIENDGGQRLFVAYARDATADSAMESTTALANAITDLSRTPIIVISRRGLIQSFNVAAVAAFGHEAAEIIGKNVNLLMPETVAKYHDRYLATYAKTRVKNIIGSIRKLSAKRRDGSQFPVQLSVREVIPAAGVKEAVYVGFVFDLTAKLEKIKAGMINDAIVDISFYPLIAIADDGMVLRFSASAEATFGYQSSEVLGRNVKMLMPPDVAAEHDHYLQRFLGKHRRSELTVQRTVRAMRKCGEVFHAKIFVRELRTPTGHMFVGYVQDITETYESTARAAMSEAAVTLASVPIISIETNGIIRKFNPAAEECFGYSTREVLDENVKMLMPPDVGAQHDGFLSRYRDTGVKHVINGTRTVTGRRKNGELFAATLSIREVKTREQSFFTGYVRDTSRQSVFQRATSLNDAIISSAPMPFVVMDAQGTVQRINAATERFLGYSSAEVVGRNIKMLMPEPYRSEHDGYLRRYRETGEQRVLGKATRNLHAETKDGRTVAIELLVHEVKQLRGSTFVGSFRDITDEIRRESARAIARASEEGSLRAIIVMDEHGVMLRANPAAGKMLGYDPAREMINKNVTMLMFPDMEAKHDSFIKRYLRTGEKRVVDNTLRIAGRMKSGERVELNLSVREAMVDGPDGRPRSIFVGYLEDVHSSELLTLATVVNEAMMQILPIPVIVIDIIGSILKFNKAAEEAFEFDVAQVLGKNVRILMTETHQAAHDRYLEAYRRTGVKNIIDSTRELPAETKSGRLLRISLQVREVITEKAGGESQSLFIGFIKVLDKGGTN